MYLFLLILYFTMSAFYNIYVEHIGSIKTAKNIFLITVLGLASIIVGFRSIEVGVDTLTYYTLFNDFQNLKWSDIFCSYFHSAIEVGYVVLMKLSSTFIPNYYFFQLLIAILTFYFIGSYLKYFSHNPTITVILFFATGLFFASFNIQRQVFVSAVIAFSFMQYAKGKKAYSMFLFILSLTFHVSAIICGIIFLVWKFRNRDKLIRALSVVFLCLPLLGGGLMNLFFIITMEKYGSYMDNSLRMQTAGFVQLLWIMESLCMLLVIFKSSSSKYKAIALLAILYMSFNILGLSINYAERVGLYFIPFMYITIDKAIILFKQDIRILFSIGIMMVMCILYYLSSFGSKLNYHTFL